MSLPNARPMVESGLCNARSTGAPSDGKKRIVAIPSGRLVPYPTNDNACEGLSARELAGKGAFRAFRRNRTRTSADPRAEGAKGPTAKGVSDAQVHFVHAARDPR